MRARCARSRGRARMRVTRRSLNPRPDIAWPAAARWAPAGPRKGSSCASRAVLNAQQRRDVTSAPFQDRWLLTHSDQPKVIDPRARPKGAKAHRPGPSAAAGARARRLWRRGLTTGSAHAWPAAPPVRSPARPRRRRPWPRGTHLAGWGSWPRGRAGAGARRASRTLRGAARSSATPCASLGARGAARSAGARLGRAQKGQHRDPGRRAAQPVPPLRARAPSCGEAAASSRTGTILARTTAPYFESRRTQAAPCLQQTYDNGCDARARCAQRTPGHLLASQRHCLSVTVEDWEALSSHRQGQRRPLQRAWLEQASPWLQQALPLLEQASPWPERAWPAWPWRAWPPAPSLAPPPRAAA